MVILQAFSGGLEILIAAPKEKSAGEFARQHVRHQADAVAEQKLHCFPICLGVDLWLAAQHLWQKTQGVFVQPLKHVALYGGVMKGDFTVFADRCFQQALEYGLLRVRQTPDEQVLKVAGGIECFDQLRFVLELAKYPS